MLMVWHERNHGHAAQRWLRDEVLAVAVAAGRTEVGAAKARPG